MMDVKKELVFTTTRSGGKGGQNVNKVETAVLAAFHIAGSALFTPAQKELLLQKLRANINSEGRLLVRSQQYRTQLENKNDATKKINTMLAKALLKKKARIATKAGKGAIEKRLERKKQQGERKENRKKVQL